MIVSYYGIVGCDLLWDANGAFLIAPSSYKPEMLLERGFQTDSEGRWVRRLAPDETAYLQSLGGAVSATLPPPVQTAVPGWETPEEHAAGNRLSWFSLALMIIAIGCTLTRLHSSFVGYISGTCSLASIVLMITARVKYPNNRFAKVLMIIYIALILLSVIGLIMLGYIIGQACGACFESCGNCRMAG